MKLLGPISIYLWGFVSMVAFSALQGCDPLAHRDLAVTPSICPVNLQGGYVSSEFGYRVHPIFGKRKLHEGIDLAVDEGTPVVATANGVVTYAEEEKGYGKIVRVDHGGQLVSGYAHNSKLLVQVGEYVVKGQIIALSGKTGNVTGEHVHYEVRYKDKALNPRRFLPQIVESQKP